MLFNTGRANMPVSGSHVAIIGDRTVEGWVQAGGYCAGHDQHRLYFSATFDRPFSAHGTWKDGALTSGSSESTNGAGKNGGWVTFDCGGAVVAKIGTAYTGVDGARANLDAETSSQGFDFDATRAAAHARWDAMLRKVAISGGAPDRRVAFHTALYHALMHPNAIADVDRSYMGWRFAADLLPAPGPVTVDGVPYQAPPTAGDERNFVEARRQSLAVPAGRWATAYVLGATHNGDVDTAATVTYDDGEHRDRPAAADRLGRTRRVRQHHRDRDAHRLRAGQGQDGPPVAIFGTRLALDPGKTARSIALPGDPRVELYAITLGD